MKSIKFTDGCPNGCAFCYEKKDMVFYDPEIPVGEDIQVLDMNFLANPRFRHIARFLGFKSKSVELVCGIDYRRLDQSVANLLYNCGFKNIRWAWDYSVQDNLKHKRVWSMLKKAGFKSEELSVFMIVNWKIPFVICCQKLDLLKVWNVKVNDCCYDGGYPKSEIDFNNNKRFNGKRFWDYKDIKRFRRMCRKHNQLVRFKCDPEYKKNRVWR